MTPTIPANPQLLHPFPLAIIVAVARHGVIGGDNRLLWRLPEDLKQFKALTRGHTVIMGRKTWESLPGLLPERQNIVITRARDTSAIVSKGGEAVGSLAEAIDRATLPAPTFCIGGGEIYRQALAFTAVIYLTRIDAEFAGDTFFPELPDSEWQCVEREAHPHGALPYAFERWERVYCFPD